MNKKICQTKKKLTSLDFKVYSLWKNITKKFQNVKSPEKTQWSRYITSHFVYKNKPTT